MTIEQYASEGKQELQTADAVTLSNILTRRIRFVHEEYIKTGRCTPYLLDEILLMIGDERVEEFDGLEVAINLHPETVKIEALPPDVKDSRREGKIRQREEDIETKINDVVTQLGQADVDTITLRLVGAHRDSQTNADVYPRILGQVQSLNGQAVEIPKLSIPLVMIVQAGPNPVRIIPKNVRGKGT